MRVSVMFLAAAVVKVNWVHVSDLSFPALKQVSNKHSQTDVVILSLATVFA